MSHPPPSHQPVSTPQSTSIAFSPPHQTAGQYPGNSGQSNSQNGGWDRIFQLITELWDFDKRENAVAELSKCRDSFEDLAPVLWHSFGAMTALLQETIYIYPLLSPPRLSMPRASRVCNVLALLQCVASHPETRQLFLNAHIPLFVYPFLNIVAKNRQFEYLRLTSLGVIGGLVKADDPNVISFLLQTEIVSLCLRIMENGALLSKAVATFIIQKILQDKQGLEYICETAERFYSVSKVLLYMSNSLPDTPPEHCSRLIRHIVRCYLRLSDNPRAREALAQCLPESIISKFLTVCLNEEVTKKCMLQLRQNISSNKPLPSLPSENQANTQSSAVSQNNLGNNNSSFPSAAATSPLHQVVIPSTYKQYAAATSQITNSTQPRQFLPQ